MRVIQPFFKSFIILCILSPTCLLAQLQDKIAQHVEADQLYIEGKYEKAIDKYQQASDLYNTNNQIGSYALVNLMIAECNVRLGKAKEGLELSQNTLEYIKNNDLDDPYLLAEAYSVVGDAYLNMGRNDKALEFLLSSLEQFELAGIQESPELANCYNDLGTIYLNNGNNNLALQFHQNALNLRIKLLGENSIEVGDSHNNLGLVYSGFNYRKANSSFDQALQIYVSRLGPNHPKVALCYNNLALVNDLRERYDASLEYLDKVLSIWSSTYDGDHPIKAFTYLSMGRVNYNKGEYDQSILDLQKALKSYLNLFGDKHPEIANTFNLLGQVSLAKGDFESSVEYFQKGIYANLFDQELQDKYINPQLENYYNADILLYSLQQKAEAFENYHYNKTLKMRDLNAALETLELADQLVSRIRKIRLGEKDKLSLSAKASEIYEAGVELTFNISEVSTKAKYFRELAFNFAEKSKSSTLLSAIQDTNAKQFSGIPTELIEKETSLKNDINFYERELAANSGKENEQTIRAQLLSLNKQYNDFIKQLEVDFPKYYNLKFNESHINLAELQKSLDEETMLITHFVTDNHVYTFYVGSGFMKVFKNDKIDKFDNYVTGLRNSIKFDIKEHYLKAASKLSDQLLPAKIPPKINKLVIIPEGQLATIPFEVLMEESPHEESTDYKQLPYLIKKYNISYDNSATLYAQRKQEIDNYEGETEDILLVAPVNFRNEYYANMSSNLSDLPGSKAEIDEIKYLFKGKEHDTRILTDADATELNFKKQELHKYKYLHFATHGLVNESKPELSRIFLKPTYNDIEDGSLYSGEIYNININADLVCLSACQTGLGQVSKGEGIIGLSRALLYAGAENMVVSLWTVLDESTSQLMINFYDNHLYSMYSNTFARALRKAKLSLINDDLYSRPYFWAPFILIGE